jgi:hypothetical protein
MNTGYVDVGFGMANSDNYQGTGPETIVVAMYGSPEVVASAPAPAAPSTPAPKPTPTPAPAPAAEPTPAPQPEVNATPTAPQTEKKAAPAPPAVLPQKVARIQLLSSTSASWSSFAVSAVATVAIAIFFLRHGLLLRRVIVKSEAFVHRHPFLDIALVAVATVAVVLVQSDGIIR